MLGKVISTEHIFSGICCQIFSRKSNNLSRFLQRLRVCAEQRHGDLIPLWLTGDDHSRYTICWKTLY